MDKCNSKIIKRISFDNYREQDKSKNSDEHLFEYCNLIDVIQKGRLIEMFKVIFFTLAFINKHELLIQKATMTSCDLLVIVKIKIF